MLQKKKRVVAADEKRPTTNSASLIGSSAVTLRNIYEFLDDHELVQMQVVGADRQRNEWRYVQEEIEKRASQIPGVKEEEKANVWRIYVCFRMLEEDNIRSLFTPFAKIPQLPAVSVDRHAKGVFSRKIPDLPPAPVDIYASIRDKSQRSELTAQEGQLLEKHRLLLFFPKLPPPPIDPWASLRNKRTLYELTSTEVHLLFTHGLLDKELQQLGRSDCEKAALIMGSPLLRARLPGNELTTNRPPSPSWLSRILGIVLTPIVSVVIGVVIAATISMLRLLWSIVCLAASPFFLIHLWGKEKDEEYKGCIFMFSSIGAIFFHAFSLVILPLYYLVIGFYTGG